MDQYVLYVIILILLILASMFFSGSEAAFFSFSKIKLKNIPKNSPLIKLRKLMEHPEDVIITLLLGNEIVNILFTVLMAKLVNQAVLSYPIWFKTGLATALSMIILLFLGEVTPKTVAVNYYHHYSLLSIKPFAIFFKLVKPLRNVIRRITTFFNKNKVIDDEVVDEKSFLYLTDRCAETGDIEKEHVEMIKKVFHFDDIKVKSIMTKFDNFYALDYNLPLSEIVKEVSNSIYSRIPIYRGQKENVIGVLHKKDMLRFKESLPDEDFSLIDILYDPIFSFENEPINRVFAQMKRQKIHMAIIKNKNEKVVGLITLEDIVEELTGEIEDEKERVII